MDATVVIALMAGLSGAATGIGALVVNRKDVATRADAGYVDTNLKAMQAIVEAQIAETTRQHERHDAEVAELRAKLKACEGRCNECLARIKALETR